MGIKDYNLIHYDYWPIYCFINQSNSSVVKYLFDLSKLYLYDRILK